MQKKTEKLILSIFLIFITHLTFAQTYNIDYYGIVSTEIDANMAKMTSDLYYTQLTEINNFSTQDKRNGTSALNQEPDPENFSDSNLSFYALITKDEKTEKWTSIFKVIDKYKNEEHSKIKSYDSFYKILTEPKSVLQETIKTLIENDSNVSTIARNQNNLEAAKNTSLESTELLSGTWAGESSIDKIVILRGGRGFVIFKNGASMNIGIELSNSSDGQEKHFSGSGQVILVELLLSLTTFSLVIFS